MKHNHFWTHLFTLCLDFIRTSEGIWFCLCFATRVPLIMLSQCVVCECFFPSVFCSSWPLTQALSLLLCCLGQSPCTLATQPHGHIMVCGYPDTGKSGSGAPHSDPDPLFFTPQLPGPSRVPAEVTRGLSIPGMGLQTCMKRSVWCGSILGYVTVLIWL